MLTVRVADLTAMAHSDLELPPELPGPSPFYVTSLKRTPRARMQSEILLALLIIEWGARMSTNDSFLSQEQDISGYCSD